MKILANPTLASFLIQKVTLLPQKSYDSLGQATFLQHCSLHKSANIPYINQGYGPLLLGVKYDISSHSPNSTIVYD